jgi:hypothetical protein
MKRVTLTGAVLATAVALAFVGTTAHATEPATSSGKTAQVKCIGGNACKGQSACASASSSCKGMNSCKGKGFVMSSNAEECTKAGGHVEKAE